jgi:hypothetical protein
MPISMTAPVPLALECQTLFRSQCNELLSNMSFDFRVQLPGERKSSGRMAARLLRNKSTSNAPWIVVQAAIFTLPALWVSTSSTSLV